VASVSEQALISELGRLVSEERNPRTMDIDLLPTEDVLRRINEEDKGVAFAVEKVIPEIADCVDRITVAFREGGRLIYMGAGTSGRIGVLDASECPPTFRVPPTMVVGLIAGGYDALLEAAEGAEDSRSLGAEALAEIGLAAKDVVVGIAASGRTPWVVGGLDYARKVGATAVALSCNPDSTIAAIADIAISPVVGPEALTGSTRMKAGTAMKLVLNMLTTASMIGIGKTYENLMVDLKASNEKLVARAARIVIQATGCTVDEARLALARTENDVKLAILVVKTGMSPADARSALERSDGFLRQAIEDAGRV
jgi:N-acetylmuramic acid 6-phosphate etherase